MDLGVDQVVARATAQRVDQVEAREEDLGEALAVLEATRLISSRKTISPVEIQRNIEQIKSSNNRKKNHNIHK